MGRYYGPAGFAWAWLYRDTWRPPARLLFYVVYPLISAFCLAAAGVYAFSTFDTLTRIVGLGGPLLGLLFFRPRGYGSEDTPPQGQGEGQAV